MLRVFACLTTEHDLRLVALAGIIALVGSHTAITLLRHVHRLEGLARQTWLCAAALAAGSAIWATHFIGMLAFEPPVPVSYGVGLTAASLLMAIVLTGVGLCIAVCRASWGTQALGGAVVGLGVAAMHYTGMSALLLPGHLLWDAGLVTASIVLGCVLAATALPLAMAGGRWRSLAAAGLLTCAICALHFTGMAAVSVVLTGVATISASALPPVMLAVNIAVACLVILFLSAAGLFLDRRNARQRAAERQNLHELADIAMEGLLVCDGDRVVAVNTSFEQIIGRPSNSLVGAAIDALFESEHDLSTVVTAEAAGEWIVVSADGARVPVELMHKPIHYSGRAHRVVAVRDLRERRKAEEDIRFLAHHDALTTLDNRTSFSMALTRQLSEQARFGQPFALLALDLDRFKEVNDTFGHGVGDLLLKRVAGRLRRFVRETDVVARLGGDEFAILCAAPTSTAEAASLARRIVELVARPYILSGNILNVSVSVGVALAPQDGPGAELLMKNADLALYRAKSEGRNAVRFFEHGVDMQMQNRRTLELDLRRGLSHDEMEVFYQPLFNVDAQRVQGFEALVRWRHPDRGLVPPGDFIPLAEETGLIVPIGRFVLQSAVRQAVAWGDDITMAVNLSAVQFASGNLVSEVASALAETGLPAWRLELEITESVLLSEGADTLAILHTLREMGVRISMDDFGTGYSSLRYLRAFPFDKIKIDRSFVQEMMTNAECAAIIWAVVGLGQRLGIETTAEGVETREQMAELQRQGCDVLQGYFVGKPVPANEAATFLPTRIMEPV